MTDPSTTPRHVVLVGLMGSGKTSVGRVVADALGWPLSDSDATIEAAEGRTSGAVREERGTAALHALERRHLLDALAAPTPSVICPAASVVDDAGCREALRDPSLLVAWLTARPETAAARFPAQGHRAWYGDDPAVFLAEQAVRREPWLRQVADHVLATDDEPPEVLARRIVDRIRG